MRLGEAVKTFAWVPDRQMLQFLAIPDLSRITLLLIRQGLADE